MNEKKLFWFCWSFEGKSLETGETIGVSVYAGRKNKEHPVCLQEIYLAKEAAGLHKSAVIINILFLGCMTKSEFESGVDLESE